MNGHTIPTVVCDVLVLHVAFKQDMQSFRQSRSS
jgi:hypothetical protein